jgi:hypothetical protein
MVKAMKKQLSHHNINIVTGFVIVGISVIDIDISAILQSRSILTNMSDNNPIKFLVA